MPEVGPDRWALLLTPLQGEEETGYNPTFKAELLPHLSPIGPGVTCSIKGFGEVMARYRREEGGSSQRRPHPRHETPLQIRGYSKGLPNRSATL